MSLKEIYDYERLEISQNSSIKLVSLSKWSGAQYAKTDLVADLLFELGFCPAVQDILAHPILYSKNGKRLIGDVMFETWATTDEYSGRMLLKVSETEDYTELGANKSSEEIVAATEWCTQNQFDFRMIDQRQIRTPCLANARYFQSFLDTIPDPEGDAMHALLNCLETSPVSIEYSIANLVNAGIAASDASHFIQRCIAHGWVRCNLDQPFTNQSRIWLRHGIFTDDDRKDPFLRTILSVPCQP